MRENGDIYMTKLGIALHTLYYVLTVLSLFDYNYRGYGVGKAFLFWILAVIVSFPIVLLYLGDGIRDFIKCKNAFSIIKLVAVILLVPLSLLCGTSAGVVESVVWNVYFFAVFVIQLLSLFSKHIKSQ